MPPGLLQVTHEQPGSRILASADMPLANRMGHGTTALVDADLLAVEQIF